MTSSSVRLYRSTDTGAPALSGTAGALIGVLDACLVSGYGSVTLSSLTAAAGVATATVAAGHGLVAAGPVGPVVRLEGATPAGLDGDWRVEILSATQFRYTATGVPDGPATGTVTAKRAPAGWSRPWTGTNKAVYRPTDPAATGQCLRVDHAGTTTARVRAYEAMTDVDTGTGPAPTDAQSAGGYYWAVSAAAGATARPWILVADGRSAHLCVLVDGSAGWAWYSWGDLRPYPASDPWGGWITGATAGTAAWYVSQAYNWSAPSMRAVHRAYTGLAGAVAVTLGADAAQGGNVGHGALAYPHAPDGRAWMAPLRVQESAAAYRGEVRGALAPLHPATAIPHGSVLEGIYGLDGGAALVVVLSAGTAGVYGAVALPIAGGWD